MIITLGIIALLLAIALGVCIWYVRGILRLMFEVTTDIQRMQDDLNDFAKHLDNVHEMEMYYGDETLQALIRHSKKTIDNINNFKNLFEVENEKETKKEVD
jgi:predicted PurR-regulated permease PerM